MDRRGHDEWTGKVLLDEQLRLRALEMATFRADASSEGVKAIVDRAKAYYAFLSGSYSEGQTVH